MSKRRNADLVEDIIEAITRIERYTAGLTLDAFLADTKTQDATVRNLEIIGEAVKGLSPDFSKKHPGVPWQEIAGHARPPGLFVSMQLRALILRIKGSR